jgi:hypothetical protein
LLAEDGFLNAAFENTSIILSYTRNLYDTALTVPALNALTILLKIFALFAGDMVGQIKNRIFGPEMSSRFAWDATEQKLYHPLWPLFINLPHRLQKRI